MRYTERHGGVAVIKDKSKHKEAMEKLAKVEDAEETGCKRCKYETWTNQLLPCRLCKRDKEDKFERVVERLEEEAKANMKLGCELQTKEFHEGALIRFSKKNAFIEAIEIVKEECGINE